MTSMSEKHSIFAAALALVALCSCQSLPSRDAGPERQVKSPPPPAPPAVGHGSPDPALAARQIPTPYGSGVMPVGYHHHVGGMPHGNCPCCGPGTLPAFAFSGAAVEDPDMPWKPPGIKGPWPPD